AYIIKEDNMKKLKHTGELDYFEYTDSDKYYITAIYKTNEAFWTLTFSCNNSEQEEYKDTIIDFAKEVKFSNQTL
ncbi:MAG: hypothetical protein K2K01_05795, partial [Eubacterium sp.]|nr:hypothetical protein [Eubacterium sp.]